MIGKNPSFSQTYNIVTGIVLYHVIWKGRKKMPAFVGPIQLNIIGESAVFKVGDTFSLSPKSSNKTSFGSGAANTGDFINTENVFNITKFEDSDVIDQSNLFNF